MMATEQKLLTAEDLWNMPDNGGRRELWDGVLLEMSPAGGRHGHVMTTSAILLGTHVKTTGQGRVLTGDVGIVLHRDPDRVLAPDLCFISTERLPADEMPDGFLNVVPDFVIEIVSPGDRAAEVQDKVDAWLDAGVRLVWAVYPKSRSVMAFRSHAEARRYTGDDMIDAAPVLPEFSVPVAEFFA